MTDFVFLDFKVSADGDCSLDIRRWLLLGRKAMTKLEHVLKSKDIILLTKVRIIKPMVFPVVMYRCETWTIKRALKNQCFYTVVLENTIESPLENKEIKLVNLEGNQSWIFFGRTGAEAEAPILWPPDANNWLTGKNPDAGEDWRQKEKRETEDEMVGWHNLFNGHEVGCTPGDGEGQGSLPCYNPWGHKEWLSSWTTIT